MSLSQDRMAEVMDQMFAECRELRAKAQREYAHDPSNAFRNFEQLSNELGITREKVLWIFLKKHLDGILAYINGYESQRESVEGRINDAVVYLTLLRGMVEDRKLRLKIAEPILVQQPVVSRPRRDNP